MQGNRVRRSLKSGHGVSRSWRISAEGAPVLPVVRNYSKMIDASNGTPKTPALEHQPARSDLAVLQSGRRTGNPRLLEVVLFRISFSA
jgi:hypothetical protein